MSRNDIKFRVFLGLCIALFVAVLVFAALFQPYMEARAFNRATGKNVSMWEAMFIELRVQEEAK